MSDQDKKEVVTAEEAELLGQEEDLVGKKESGENLTAEETQTLEQINALKGSLKERLGKDTPEKPKEEFASIDAQKRHFKKKFETEKAEKERLAKELEAAKKGATTTEEKNEWQEKIDFLIEHKEVSKPEFDFISTFAKGKKLSLEDAHESKEVKDYLNYQREKVKRESKVLGSSAASSTSTPKSRQEIAEMSREDHQKLAMDNIRKQKEGGEV